MRRGGVWALQRRCERVAAELGLPRPFALAQLIGAIEQKRGRPLKVIEEHLGTVENMPCGIWLPFPEVDVVVVEQWASQAHREHICLHELAHILCDHRGSAVLASGYLAKLLPDLAPEQVAKVLARTSYDSEQEREAEVMATLLGRYLAPPSGSGGPGRNGSTPALRDEVMEQLAKALGTDKLP